MIHQDDPGDWICENAVNKNQERSIKLVIEEEVLELIGVGDRVLGVRETEP